MAGTRAIRKFLSLKPPTNVPWILEIFPNNTLTTTDVTLLTKYIDQPSLKLCISLNYVYTHKTQSLSKAMFGGRAYLLQLMIPSLMTSYPIFNCTHLNDCAAYKSYLP